jgi:hypothetical protein
MFNVYYQVHRRRKAQLTATAQGCKSMQKKWRIPEPIPKELIETDYWIEEHTLPGI